jgi:hypothetical protein
LTINWNQENIVSMVSLANCTKFSYSHRYVLNSGLYMIVALM